MTKCTHCDATVLSGEITGAFDTVEEAACLIWAELCPGMVMGDDDIPHYENAAKAVLALAATPAVGGEPVAWGRVIDGKAVTVSINWTPANDEPLYAAQPASPLRRQTEQELQAEIEACLAPDNMRAAAPEQPPTSATVKMLVDAIDAKNARIAQLEEALGKAVLSEQPAAGCCKGLAPVSECQCEQERLAAGHAPYQRSAPAAGCGDPNCKDPNCTYGKGSNHLAQPQYFSECLRAGACHGICESTACTNYGKDIVV